MVVSTEGATPLLSPSLTAPLHWSWSCAFAPTATSHCTVCRRHRGECKEKGWNAGAASMRSISLEPPSPSPRAEEGGGVTKAARPRRCWLRPGGAGLFGTARSRGSREIVPILAMPRSTSTRSPLLNERVTAAPDVGAAVAGWEFPSIGR